MLNPALMPSSPQGGGAKSPIFMPIVSINRSSLSMKACIWSRPSINDRFEIRSVWSTKEKPGFWPGFSFVAEAEAAGSLLFYWGHSPRAPRAFSAALRAPPLNFCFFAIASEENLITFAIVIMVTLR